MQQMLAIRTKRGEAVNRREFIGVSAASAAWALAEPAIALTEPRTDAIVIFDARFKEARRFAAIATEQYRLRAFSFVEDATALWHDQLVNALNKGTSLIGLTAGGARFCLQLMAGPGMRFVHHVTHTASATAHDCWIGEVSTDRELRCATAWPDQAAKIAIRHAVATSRREVGPTMSSQYPTFRLPAAEQLESWALAPAPAALRDNRPFSEWNS